MFEVSAFGIGLLIACIVTVFAIYGHVPPILFKGGGPRKNEGARHARYVGRARRPFPPEPRLQGFRDAQGYNAPPKVELKDLRADEDAILTATAGWIRIKVRCGFRLITLSIWWRRRAAFEAQPAGQENDGIPDDSGGFEQRENAGKDFAMNRKDFHFGATGA